MLHYYASQSGCIFPYLALGRPPELDSSSGEVVLRQLPLLLTCSAAAALCSSSEQGVATATSCLQAARTITTRAGVSFTGRLSADSSSTGNSSVTSSAASSRNSNSSSVSRTEWGKKSLNYRLQQEQRSSQPSSAETFSMPGLQPAEQLMGATVHLLQQLIRRVVGAQLAAMLSAEQLQAGRLVSSSNNSSSMQNADSGAQLVLPQDCEGTPQPAQQQQQQQPEFDVELALALTASINDIKVCMRQLQDCMGLQLQQLASSSPPASAVCAGSDRIQQQCQQLTYAVQHLEAGVRLLSWAPGAADLRPLQESCYEHCRQLVSATRIQFAPLLSSAAFLGTMASTVHGQQLLQALLSLTATDVKVERLQLYAHSFLLQGMMACMLMLLAHASTGADAAGLTAPVPVAGAAAAEQQHRVAAGSMADVPVDSAAAPAPAGQLLAASGTVGGSILQALPAQPALVAATALMGHVLFLSGHSMPLDSVPGDGCDDAQTSWALLNVDAEYTSQQIGSFKPMHPSSDLKAAVSALGPPLQATAEQLGCPVGVQQLLTLQGQVQLTAHLLRRLLDSLDLASANPDRSGDCSSNNRGNGVGINSSSSSSNEPPDLDSSPQQAAAAQAPPCLASGLGAALVKLEGNLLPLVASVHSAIQQQCGAEAASASSISDTATASGAARRKARKHQQRRQQQQQQPKAAEKKPVGSSAGKLVLPQLPALAASLKAAGSALCSALPCSYLCNNPGCVNTSGVSEGFTLVRGKACVCGGCVGVKSPHPVLAAAPADALAARYCSADCQEAHQQHHSSLCKQLGKLAAACKLPA